MPTRKPNNSTCQFAFCLYQPMLHGPIQSKNFGASSNKKSYISIASKMIGIAPNKQLLLSSISLLMVLLICFAMLVCRTLLKSIVLCLPNTLAECYGIFLLKFIRGDGREVTPL